MPDKRDVHVDALLTGLAIEYKNDPAGYIADQVCPKVSVVKESDKYATYDKQNRFRLPDALRAVKTESKEVDWGVGTSTYTVEEYALHVLISDRERANADPPFNLDIDGTELLTDLLMNAAEARVATQMTTSGSFLSGHAETLAGQDQWSDGANSDPIGDINDAHQTVKDDTGIMANTLILGWQVYNKLKVHSKILARMGNANLGVVTTSVLSLLFDVPQMLIGGAQKLTSNPGQSTETYGYVWGKNAVLAYINPSVRTTKGLTFSLRPMTQDFQVGRYRVDSKKSDKIEVSHAMDEVVTASGCGYLFASAIA